MYPYETRIYIALLTTGCIVILLIIIFIVATARYHRKKVAVHTRTIQEEMRILEAERNRIARDLHDELNSGLTGLRLKLSLLPAADAPSRRRIEEACEYADSLMAAIRTITNQLLPVVLQRQGLQAALEELILRLQEAGQYRVDYTLRLPAYPIREEAAMHIYRLVQEILNNIVKHARATAIRFTICLSRHILLVLIEDNGAGFNLRAAAGNAGLGLRNIRMRADVLQARIYVTSSAGKGTRYQLEIPERVLRQEEAV